MLHSIYIAYALAVVASAHEINLGTAASFGVLAYSTITNTGHTTISQNMGVYPGTAITGDPSVSGRTYSDTPQASVAQNNATNAYNLAVASTATKDLTGQDLGGMTLTPGIYHFASSAGLTGKLTLNSFNNIKSKFIFQIGSTITTASSSSIVLINGTRSCQIIWQVGSSATLGTYSHFAGNIIALASITAATGVTVRGGLYALNGAVTLDNNTVSSGGLCC